MSAAKCEPGWGEGLSSQTVPRLRDHPILPLRVDPPPPGEGKNSPPLAIEHTFAFSRRKAPEVCLHPLPLKPEGAGNAGRLVRPLPHVRGSKAKKHTR